MLPPDFDKKPKRGFAMPFDAWLRGSLSDVLTDTLSEASVRRRGLIEPTAATSVRETFMQGDANWMKPWLLMIIELWCRQVLDRTTAGSSCDA